MSDRLDDIKFLLKRTDNLDSNVRPLKRKVNELHETVNEKLKLMTDVLNQHQIFLELVQGNLREERELRMQLAKTFTDRLQKEVETNNNLVAEIINVQQKYMQGINESIARETRLHQKIMDLEEKVENLEEMYRFSTFK